MPEFYPISLIHALQVTPVARVIGDQFEDGSTATRRVWAAQYFKRRFKVQHAPLTLAEWRYLRSFYSARNGTYDSFWFRDNVNRDGNALVRFASDLPHSFSGSARMVQLDLDEVSPVRALPETEEVTTAAGRTPFVWYDANRELYYLHAGTAYTEADTWDELAAYRAAWQGGTSLSLGGTTAQAQYYQFAASQWARSGTVTALTGTQPAVTIFAIARHGTVSSKEVICGIGAMGSGKALGIAVAADNRYEPWIGGSETWTNARTNNSAINTWRSFAVVWAASSNTATLYTNAASVGADSNARSLTAGSLTLGSAIDGTLKCTGHVGQLLVFAGALTLAQIKAVHNLLGIQYGLSIVA